MQFVRSHFALAALAAGILVTPAAQAADAAHGKIIFQQKYGCYECHGLVGQGSTVTSGGRVIARTQLPYEAFAQFVRTTDRNMPAFKEAILPDNDLADIYAYLQSVPENPDPKTIKVLQDIK